MFRAGDIVYHKLTKETWILAVDQDQDNVYPCRWPETQAKAGHCKLVESATDAMRKKQLIDSSKIKEFTDIRFRLARKQLTDD